MKDKLARERAELALQEIRDHRHKALNVSIKDCPKCKHPALAQFVNRKIHELTPQDVVDGNMRWTQAHYQCLTCGSKFTCSEKCVCELLDEDKN